MYLCVHIARRLFGSYDKTLPGQTVGISCKLNSLQETLLGLSLVGLQKVNAGLRNRKSCLQIRTSKVFYLILFTIFFILTHYILFILERAGL